MWKGVADENGMMIDTKSTLSSSTMNRTNSFLMMNRSGQSLPGQSHTSVKKEQGELKTEQQD